MVAAKWMQQNPLDSFASIRKLARITVNERDNYQTTTNTAFTCYSATAPEPTTTSCQLRPVAASSSIPTTTTKKEKKLIFCPFQNNFLTRENSTCWSRRNLSEFQCDPISVPAQQQDASTFSIIVELCCCQTLIDIRVGDTLVASLTIRFGFSEDCRLFCRRCCSSSLEAELVTLYSQLLMLSPKQLQLHCLRAVLLFLLAL